jgi:hypothetical protein
MKKPKTDWAPNLRAVKFTAKQEEWLHKEAAESARSISDVIRGAVQTAMFKKSINKAVVQARATRQA